MFRCIFIQDFQTKQKFWGIEDYDVTSSGQAYPYTEKCDCEKRAGVLTLKDRYDSTNDMTLSDLKKMDKLQDRE